MSCREKECRNKRACLILGQCMFEHEFFKDNREARKELRRVSRMQDVVRLFHKHTTEVVILGEYNGKAQMVIPSEYASKRLDKRLEKGWKREKVKEYKLREHKMVALDPVTMRLYQARMKRVAEADVEFGYIYDEKPRGDFHISE